MNDIHSLGVTVWGISAALWVVSALLAARREKTARHRTEAVLGAETPAAGRLKRRPVVRGGARAWLTATGTAGAVYALVGGSVGLLPAVAAGYAAWRWDRNRASPHERGERGEAAAAQLPLAADLLAACVAAGASPVVAARAVGESLRGPVGERLARGAAEVRLGGEPGEAWRHVREIPGAAPLARLLERADESGAPAAEPVARLAADARAERGRAATAKARRAAVLMTAPVGLCFLPAFVAVGVLPVVIGLAEGLLGAG
ncbi:type II secretion system F family protein [Streptomyces sp. NPDC050703]|uniref:type II secretion system F family protein n=1 Tax=Streptomyces sp. NPDC050703 TaxID=3157218 RepID=UPI00343D7F01